MTEFKTPDDDLEDTAAQIEAGRLLFAQECKFIWGATNIEGLPEAGLPEVAFGGRSNVGKSSLLNALTGRNSLARASQTPGCTRQVNFFDLGDRLRLVDLPGYGYAKESKVKVRAWTDLIRAFLKGRVTLCRVCLLVDGRHGLKDSDIDMMTMLDASAVSYQIILTKADRVGAEELKRRGAETEAVLRKHPAAYPLVMATSSDSGLGIPKLRLELERFAARV
ncbi:putative GTP-binding protein EngB [uncultured Gammaproteobacteria bacterium]